MPTRFYKQLSDVLSRYAQRLSTAMLFLSVFLPVPTFASRLGQEVNIFSEVLLHSPDGRWSVTSIRGVKFEDGYARLYIEGPKLDRKIFLKYFRSGKLIWSPDSRTLVFLDYHSPEETAIKAFLLEPTGVREVPQIDGLVRNVVEAELKGSELIFYYVDLIAIHAGSRLSLRATPSFLLPKTDHPLHEMKFVFDVDVAIPKVSLLRKSKMTR